MENPQLTIEWNCIDLPACEPGMRIGIQRGKEVIDDQELPQEMLHFRFAVTVKADSKDFAGAFVQGTRGERFVYLCWGTRNGEGFQMTGRSKIGLNTTLPWQRVESHLAANRPLRATIRLRNAKGMPALASLKPEMVNWQL